jgi:hypothetical protein
MMMQTRKNLLKAIGLSKGKPGLQKGFMLMNRYQQMILMRNS